MTVQSDMALLAAGSYWDIRKSGVGFDNDDPLPEGWKVLTRYDKSDSGSNASTGFSARVYQNTSTNEIVISYGGTEFDTSSIGLVADFLNGNIPLATGGQSTQALEAAKLYQRVKAAPTLSDNISFTGHSLGGGIASVMAVWFNRPAYVFAAAPFQKSADSAQSTTLPDLFSLDRALPYVRFTLGSVADPALLSYDPRTDFAARESNVKAFAIKGELLEAKLGMLNWIEGSSTPLYNNPAITLDAGNKHSIDLHAAALLVPNFQTQAGLVPNSLTVLMDKFLYGGDVLGNQQIIITKLLRNEVGVRDDQGTVLLSANGMLTHFAADLHKLGTNIAGLNQVAQDALIAQGIEWYYWQGVDYAGQEFFTRTGELLQYTTATGAGLQGAQNKALSYVNPWLDSYLPQNAVQNSSLTPGRPNYAVYDQWNVVTGAGGSTVAALAAAKSQIFIGGAGADNFTGGDLSDLILAGGGNDTLRGGAGADLLYGGAGLDTYYADEGDTIRDSDGKGVVYLNGKQLTFATRKKGEAVWT